jgi:sugar lactone lactonase YvrE
LGNLYVADIVSDNIYKFSHTLGQIACPGQIACSGSNQFVNSSTLSPYKPHGMTFGKDGSLYVNLVLHTNLPDGEVVRLSPSGTSYQVVATGLDWPSGLASDPLSGDLFLSETAGPGNNNIYRVSVTTGAVTVYANTAADGLSFGPDGTLYAATPGGVSSITGTNKPQPATVTFITSVSCADGVAISLDEGKPFLYTDNSCGGTITKVDLHTLAQTNIVSGGSRGDFVTVGSDDCLYATQSDSVLLVANGVGNCPLPPLGPLFQNHRAVEEQAFHNSASALIQTGGSVPRGASVYDTAEVAEVNGIVPTGNVTYTFYNNNACSGSGASQTVTLSGGLVPDSPTQPSLAIGQYSFHANYTGDIVLGGNYFPSISSCGYFDAALVTTTLFNSHNISIPLGASVVNGTSVHDTAIVSGTNGITPTGSVTYTFFNNGACSGTGTTQTVNLSNGLAPNSTIHGPLPIGFYSLNATYSGDSNYPRSTSSCEFFTVAENAPNLATVVFDAANKKPWSSTETPGASAYDVATVTSGTVVATGRVSYTFYANNICSGAGSSAGSVTLTSTGSVPNSTIEGPLAAGPYSFQAVYSGDTNFLGSIGPCEPFSVRGTSTVVFDASTNVPWSGSETIGASAYDTATITTSGTIVATGIVSYTFSANGVCSGAVWTQTVTLTSSGSVHNSASTGALAAGNYSFKAVYSGDSNYSGSASTCELFTVKVSTMTTTEVLDAAGSNVTNAGVPLGSTVHDNATVRVRAPGGGPFPGPCPANLPCISLVPANRTLPAPGQTFVLNVNFTNMPTFAGWYLSVKTDTLVLNATNIVLVETFGGTAAVRSNCANGVGRDCSINDGGGVVTFAGQSLTGNDAGNGTLFSIVYRVLGGPATDVTYVNIIFSNVFDSSGRTIVDCSATPNQCLTNSISVAEPFHITGTVTYNFFSNGNCAGTPFVSGTVALGSPSGPRGPLSAGSDSFNARYSGDANYLASTGPCEPFSVSKGSPIISTAIYDAATLSPWSGSETTSASAAYDTATVTGVSGITPIGTLVYTFYTNGVCSGTGIATDNVTLTTTGAVPISKTQGQWIAGSYSFEGSYSGDPNYALSNSVCEPFTVMPSGSVGGTVLPVNKLVLLAPYIGLASLIVAATTVAAVHVRRAKHRKEDQSPPR